MKSKINVTGYHNIKLKSPYNIKTLIDLKITKKSNEHGRAFFTGIIPEEKKDKYIKTSSIKDQIEISNDIKTLFKGIVSVINIKNVNGIYHIEVEAVSYTYELDIKIKIRSFQNKDMLYTELIESVIQDYKGARFIDEVTEGASLEKLIVQYDETDWQFLKRVASHFEAVLIADTTSDKPRFWFGVPQGRNIGNIEDFHYSITRDVLNFRHTKENYNNSTDENEYTYYEIESMESLKLGDVVNVKGKNLLIKECNATMKNGILKNIYTLSTKKGIVQNKVLNENIVGASIKGKVIDIKKDNIKVHLDIDEKQNKDEAKWFPYVSHYTVEGQCGWHMMPKIKDEINLYFPKSIENEAKAISSNRKNNNLPKIQNPDIKYLRTEYGKEMMLGKKDIKFTAKEDKEGTITINLNEDNGITIESLEPININTQGKLLESSSGKINMSAKDTIYLICNTSNIFMEGTTYLRSNKVRTEGTIKK